MPEYIETKLYAVKRAGGDGWVFVKTCRTSEDDLRKDLAALGLRADELRSIPGMILSRNSSGQHATCIVDEESFLLASRAGASHQWYFDPSTDTWRPPDDPVRLTGQASAKEEAISVEFGLESTGWLPISIESGPAKFEFDVSSVFDPFEPLARWLEGLLDGTPRAIFDTEGVLVEFHTFPAADDCVRFVIALDHEGSVLEGIKFDVEVPRLKLIEAFYLPLLQFWRGNRAPGKWLDGRSASIPADYDEDALENMYDFFPVRSQRVEEALGLSG